MRYKPVLVCLSIFGAFILGLCLPRNTSRHQSEHHLSIGAPIEVSRPTGAIVSGADGGNPQPATEHRSLVVIGVMKDDRLIATTKYGKGNPWRITVGDTTYCCHEAGE